MPAEDGFGLDDDERLLPVRPGSRQNQPEDSVRLPKPRAPVAPIQNRELLREGEILESQFRPKLECSRNQGKQSQNCRYHGREASAPQAWKVKGFIAAGIMANDRINA
jgi:hypothetical protein